MKNIYFIILLLLHINGFAQTQFVGIKGGMQLSDIVTKANFLEKDIRIGVSAGLTYDYIIKNKFLVGVDVLYNQRGFKSAVILRDINGVVIFLAKDMMFNYDYLSIPFKVGYLKNWQNVFVGINTGIIQSILVSAKTSSLSINANGNTIPIKFEDVKKIVNQGDVAGFIDLNTGVSINKLFQIYLSNNYLYSFTTFTNANYFNGANSKHIGLSTSIGIRYSFLK